MWRVIFVNAYRLSAVADNSKPFVVVVNKAFSVTENWLAQGQLAKSRSYANYL